MNIQQITRNDKDYLVVSAEGSIDRIAVNMMEHNRIDSLLPFAYIRQESEEYFRFELFECERLSTWLSVPHYKSEVMQLLGFILGVEKSIGAYMLRQSNLCIDTDMVFADKGRVRFVYVPFMEPCGDGLLQLLKNIVFSVKYPLDDDYSYLFDIQNAFGRGDIKKLSDFSKWMQIANHEIEIDEDGLEIKRECVSATESSKIDNEYGYNQRNTNAGFSEPKAIEPTPAVKPVAPKKDTPSNEKASQVKDVFAEFGINIDTNKQLKSESVEKKETKKNVGFGSLFNKKEKAEAKEVVPNIVETPVVQETAPSNRNSQEIVNVLNDESRTVIENEGPSLVRLRDGQRFDMTSANNVIGSKADCNIVLSGNPTISKHHLRIYQDESGYMLEDLESTNGTWVNESRVMSNEPVRLVDNIRVRISNEEFVFQM